MGQCWQILYSKHILGIPFPALAARHALNQMDKHSILSKSLWPRSSGGKMKGYNGSKPQWEQEPSSPYRADQPDLQSMCLLVSKGHSCYRKQRMETENTNLYGLYSGCQFESSQPGYLFVFVFLFLNKRMDILWDWQILSCLNVESKWSSKV